MEAASKCNRSRLFILAAAICYYSAGLTSTRGLDLALSLAVGERESVSEIEIESVDRAPWRAKDSEQIPPPSHLIGPGRQLNEARASL